MDNVWKTIMKLGLRYEKAVQRSDVDSMITIERQLRAIEQAYPDLWITGLVVRGRNIVRRRLGIERINV